jgi:REP element-mobilizing transposase RayT
MQFNPKIHHRHSIRLPGYDYSRSGAYFITIVTQGREFLFGEIQNGEMRLTQSGQIVQRAWHDLPNHYPHVSLGAFCIMPNHVHAIILLNDDFRGGSVGDYTRRGGSIGHAPVPDVPLPGNAPLPEDSQTRPYNGINRHPLSEIIRAFKSFSARRINILRKTPGVSVWQRNFYEHIIRNNEDYNRIQFYIESNPLHWLEDQENPAQKT